jgi:hypothetical protein
MRVQDDTSECAAAPEPAQERARAPASSHAIAWSLLAILVSVCVSVVVSLTRSRIGTHDIWSDDAWVALSRRASLSQAIHMGASAPGFTILIRWWMGFHPNSIGWAQTFALVPLLFAPFIIFAGARIAGASRAAATVAACLCALSPMLLVESARLKQYTWEFAFSALFVAIAAGVHRDGPTLRWTIFAACSVVIAVPFSFALVIPTALMFVVFAVAMLHEARTSERRLELRTIAVQMAVLGCAGAIVIVARQALLFDPPQSLNDHWQNEFLGSTPTLGHTARQAVLMVRGFWGAFLYRGTTILLIVPAVAVVWYAWRHWRTVWWLLLAPLVAVVLSVMQLYPLGSIVEDRVDSWLIPWIAVVVALTLTDIERLPDVRRFVRRIPRGAAIMAVTVLALLLVAAQARSAKGYVPTRARVAVASLARATSRGDVTYVIANDWPVDLLLPGPITIITDHASETDFSVVLDRQPRSLHADNAVLAASELRSACGHTATVVGVAPTSLRRIVQNVGCTFTVEKATTNGTSSPHDDIVTVNFAPR